MKRNYDMSFVLHTEGTEGTATPLVALASRLRRRNHDVRIIMHAGLVKRYAGLGLHIEPLGSSNEYGALIDDGELLNNPRTVGNYFRSHFIPSILPTVGLIRDCIKNDPKSLLVTLDTPGLAVRLASEKYGVPCASVLVFPAHVSTEHVYEQFVRTVLRSDISELRRDLGLPAEYSFKAWWHRPLVRIAFWPEWFFQYEARDSRNVYCGFVVSEADLSSLSKWNDITCKSIDVLITGGTAKLAGSVFFAQSIEACQRMGVHATVVCNHNDLLPDLSAGRIMHLPRHDPFIELIQRARVIIHHGGMGTISEAFVCGVPQVVLARGGDRPENGRCIQRLGAGVNVSYLSGRWTEVEKAVEIALSAESMRAACERYRTMLSPATTLDVACDALENVARSA
jgi:rhamnosyltransferase subunit B